MKILALYASKNTTKPDATGAFIPQAQVFAKARRAAGDTVTLVPFDNLLPPRARFQAFCDILRNAETYDALAYFGHGTRRGLPSAGVTMGDITKLADAIHAKAAPHVIVTLYACSAANTPVVDNRKTADFEGIDGDGGCADILRDNLSAKGHTGWIDAHTVAGHATINRYTRRFYMNGQSGGTGGTWLVAPGSPEWDSWGDLLRNDRSLRFGFPYMTEKQLHERLPG
jgi:hypothetical protein